LNTNLESALLRALPVVPLRIWFSRREGRTSERYPGSAWRGAFGHSLKRLICVFRQGDCSNCPLSQSCTYVTIFEAHLTASSPRGTPSPYTLHPVCNEDTTCINITLIGEKAFANFPFVLHALRTAAERGVAHARYRFERVEQFDGQHWKVSASRPEPLHVIPNFPASRLAIKTITPVRFKHKGAFVTPDSITFELWVRALRRRIASLTVSWGDEGVISCLDEHTDVGGWETGAFRWQETDRYSGRQKRTMKMGGVHGVFTISSHQGKQLWPMLWLGQWTHIGKLTTMGLGRYEMEVAEG